MAHLAKFEKTAFRRLYSHWTREKDENGEYITYRSERVSVGHINREMTDQNYSIGEVRSPDEVAERLQNVYQKTNQQHPVYACDIVVTLPRSESLAKENVEKFMRAAYDSLVKQYGRYNNVVGAFVHLDEAQPHLHFAFLPISPRKSKQKPEFLEKLSTRAYWSRKNALQIMHKQLENDISKAMGHRVEITNGVTKEQGGNKTIAQLKAETCEIQEHIEKLAGNKKELDNLHGEYKEPLIGERYYKLSPRDYKHLYRLATAAVEQNSEYMRIKVCIDKLEHENQALKLQRLNYKNEVREEYQTELIKMQKEQLSIKQEAKPWLDIPVQLRNVVSTHIESLRQGYYVATNSLCIAMLQAYRHCKSAQQVVKVAAPAIRRLAGNTRKVTRDYCEYIKQLDYVEQRKKQYSLRQDTSWRMPLPQEVDFSQPINNKAVQYFLGDTAHCINDLLRFSNVEQYKHR